VAYRESAENKLVSINLKFEKIIFM